MEELIECKRCLLSNNDDNEIIFDNTGICNYCHQFEKTKAKYTDTDFNARFIAKKLEEIKTRSKGKKFDSILGLSGGVDSSYLALWAKENGLKPLIVHFDNGWNSELAIKNIENICRILEYDLHTIVIEWEEFKNLQLAYFRSGVVDIECASDHAIIATLYDLAFENGVHYILSGTNYQTECIMPKGWNFSKQDYTNLINIYRKFGNGNRLRSYPKKGILKQLFYRHIYKIEFVEFLNYMKYEKIETKKILESKLNWRDYGGKHFESQFTKVYQSYILPRKFGVDKRKAHLSNLICSGSISRENAKLELLNMPYNEREVKNEIDYLIKKWGIASKEFEEIMNAKPTNHEIFGTDQSILIFLNRLRNLLLFRR
jgi:N-acetyl sugar amidotransferase